MQTKKGVTREARGPSKGGGRENTTDCYLRGEERRKESSSRKNSRHYIKIFQFLLGKEREKEVCFTQKRDTFTVEEISKDRGLRKNGWKKGEKKCKFKIAAWPVGHIE